MRRTSIAATAAVVFVLSVIVVLLHREDGAASKEARGEMRTASAGAVVAPAEVFPPSTATVAGHPPLVSERLRREFATAPDLYAFAIAARRRPAEGGLFYTTAAIDACAFDRSNINVEMDRVIRARTAADSTITAMQLSTIDRYRRRCAGFSDAIARDLYDDVRRESKNRTDPLMAARDDAGLAKKDGDRETMRKSLAALVALQDPLLTSSNSVLLMSAGQRWNEARAHWFEGRDYSLSPEDDFVYRTALELATCTPAEPCLTDGRTYVACGVTGYCASDWADFYFNGPRDAAFPRSSEQDEKVRNLMDRMRDALVREDIDAFSPPN